MWVGSRQLLHTAVALLLSVICVLNQRHDTVFRIVGRSLQKQCLGRGIWRRSLGCLPRTELTVLAFVVLPVLQRNMNSCVYQESSFKNLRFFWFVGPALVDFNPSAWFAREIAIRTPKLSSLNVGSRLDFIILYRLGVQTGYRDPAMHTCMYRVEGSSSPAITPYSPPRLVNCSPPHLLDGSVLRLLVPCDLG